MKISIIVEGQTETAFSPILRTYLSQRLGMKMPKLDFVTQAGRIPKQLKLQKRVLQLLNESSDYVIALTDVHTGNNTGSKDFTDAADAKLKMQEWVGNDSRFHPHAAQHDFEAWLLPYWSTIQEMSHHNMKAPSGHPESVNHGNPPSYRIEEAFRLGKKRGYSKTRDAAIILSKKGNDLSIAINACPELKAFVNTIITLSEGEPIP